MDSLPTGSIHPWLSGSLAAILDSGAALLLRLGEHHDRHLAEHAARAYEKLQLQIAAERQVGRRGSTAAAMNGSNRADRANLCRRS